MRICATLAIAALTTLAAHPEASFAGDKAAGKGAAAWSSKSVATATNLKKIKRKYGIEVLGLRLTAAGHLLDFRYRAAIPKRAKPIIEGHLKPYVIDEKRKLMLHIPAPEKVGQLRPQHLSKRRNSVYFMLFGNPGRAIQVGDKVTVVIGDIRIEDIVVEE